MVGKGTRQLGELRVGLRVVPANALFTLEDRVVVVYKLPIHKIQILEDAKF